MDQGSQRVYAQEEAVVLICPLQESRGRSYEDIRGQEGT
jgi:hypothetical protein